MNHDEPGIPPEAASTPVDAASVEAASLKRPRGRPRKHPEGTPPPRSPSTPQRTGRKPTHGLYALKQSVTTLTTNRLDGRSKVAVAVRRWKDDVRADLGGNLTRAQETILESTAQSWVILSSVDAWIARQNTLVTRKRTLIPVVRDRMTIADSLARNLERLGLDRRAAPVADLATYIATAKVEPSASGDGGRDAE